MGGAEGGSGNDQGCWDSGQALHCIPDMLWQRAGGYDKADNGGRWAEDRRAEEAQLECEGEGGTREGGGQVEHAHGAALGTLAPVSWV